MIMYKHVSMKYVLATKLSYAHYATRKNPTKISNNASKSAATIQKEWNAENTLMYGPVVSKKKKKKKTYQKRSPAASTNSYKENINKLDKLQEILLFPLLSDKSAVVQKTPLEDPTNLVNEVVDLRTSIPSVSAILDFTKPPEDRAILEQWKARMIEQLGEDAFMKQNQETLAKGSNVHQVIREYMDGHEDAPEKLIDGCSGYWESIQPELENIDRVSGQELFVTHPHLRYRGAFDCLAYYKGRPHIIDWKVSKKKKVTIQSLYDYPLQLAAYMGATNHAPNTQCLIHPEKIQEGLIVVCYEDGSPAHLHQFNLRQCRQYWGLWLHRVYQYWSRKLND